MWEKFAEVDKSKSHQGAAVLQVPPFCDLNITAPVTVSVEVVTGSERDPKYSDAIEFTYKPRVNGEQLNNVNLPLKTTGQDSNGLGGLRTSLLGGMTTVTTVQNGALAGSLNCESLVTSATPTVSATSIQFDDKDWTDLCSDVKHLYQSGELSCKNITSLVGFIERRDTVLLEAFRSSRNSGTLSECQTKFKQYLSGLLPRL